MNGQLINILIRTSDRPEYFERCINSIRNQSYSNYRIIVSADSDETVDYVRKLGIEPIWVKKLERSQEQTFPWNLYLNRLMDEVKEGWIVFLDDDDFYLDNDSLELITRVLPPENSMLVYCMIYPDGRVLPDDEHFGIIPFERKHISMQCFCFHSKHKNNVRFDGMRAGDYRFINKLINVLNNKVSWFPATLVGLSNFGLNGAKKDLHNEKN